MTTYDGESVIQLSLQLFSSRTFPELIEEKGIGDLSVVISSRMKRGWYVKREPETAKRILVIPSYLANAPEETKKRLIEWACLPHFHRKKISATIKDKKYLLEKHIRYYIKTLEHSKTNPVIAKPEALAGNTMGCRYDLKHIFNSINERYFEGTLSSIVRWGKRASCTSYHTKRIDAKGKTFDLITIAGVYNHPDVPYYAIEAVMYHEMLHIAIPPINKGRRRVIHGRAFKEAEHRHPYFIQWQKWEREALRKILQKLRRNR